MAGKSMKSYGFKNEKFYTNKTAWMTITIFMSL